MATKQKEVTTFDVQVADFIRNHKKTGTFFIFDKKTSTLWAVGLTVFK